MRKVSIVSAVMNEAGNIERFYHVLIDTLANLNLEPELIFVCDPSSDETPDVLENLAKSDSRVKVVFMASRAGQTECMRAGMELASGEAIITMDADFQDPPEKITEFIEFWHSGFQIVHGRRSARRGDKWIYRKITWFGYAFLKWMTKGRVRHNVGDFRLIDNSVLQILLQYGDPNPFWRGISSQPGLKEAFVEYERPERASGSSKYSRRIGSPTIASRGMATFSIKPLEIVQTIGAVSLAFMFASTLFFAIQQSPSIGFASNSFFTLMLITLFSIQFLVNAIFATYMIVMIEQTRRRPNYFIAKKINFD